MGIFLNEILIFPMFTWFHLVPCLSLHGLIVAHLRDWHCYLLVFTEFSISKDLRIHIKSWSNCCLAMQLLWLHTKNIHFKRFTAIQNASFMLYIDICKCWKLNHNYWNKFKVPMFYSTVSGLFLFFFTWALVCTQVKPEYKVSDHWWQIGKWRESYLCTMWNEIIWTKWYQFCFLIKA